ncbi:MAG: FxsA family protein [Paracoccaceae bacterium]
MWLFLPFLLIPVIEIALFIQVGGLIGLWPTLGLVLLTAIAGAILVRVQGARVMFDLRSALSRLEDPTAPIAHGAMILLAGALLLTPGFFTDTLGILLLIPPVRAAVLRFAASRVRVARFDMGGKATRDDGGSPHRPAVDPTIIDADYTEVAPPQGKQPPSGWTRH